MLTLTSAAGITHACLFCLSRAWTVLLLFYFTEPWLVAGWVLYCICIVLKCIALCTVEMQVTVCLG
jgi:hypothetical protein